MFFKSNFQKIRFYHGFNIPPRLSFNSSHINFLFKYSPTNYLLWLTQIQRHPYHLVTKSPWPFLVSFFLGILVLGVIGIIQNINMSYIYFHIGFCVIKINVILPIEMDHILLTQIILVFMAP